MKLVGAVWTKTLLTVGFVLAGCSSVDVLGTRGQEQQAQPPGQELPNLLEERQQVPVSQVNAQLNDAFLQLFFGDPETEAVFRDQGDGTGYIEDIANGDVRTDSMGYGMLATVQLDQREVFDKLWAWSKQYLMFSSGPQRGLLRWRCDTGGQGCSESAATDASSIIATSLLMASSRWGSAGTHDYLVDGLGLLEVMTTIEQRNGGMVDGVVNCFDVQAALPRLGSTSPSPQVPIDYLMPAFYEIWAQYDAQRTSLWLSMADNSRALLSGVAHPTTGLLPEYVTYQGEPVADMDAYRSTTSRTFLNLALDHLWNGPSPAIVEQNERVLDFFLAQGLDDYVSEYTLDGQPLVTYNGVAHQSLVALAAGTSSDTRYDVFFERLLEIPIPTGEFRYYDGILYMLGLLTLSGQMTPG